MPVHAFPDAAIPVVRLPVNATRTMDYHLALGELSMTAYAFGYQEIESEDAGAAAPVPADETNL